MPYAGSYVWKVRQKYGSGLLLLPGVFVVVEREDGEILLFERADTKKWAMIAGWAEEGAGFRDTAITELREEAAIAGDGADLVPFAALTTSLTYPNGDLTQGYVLCFIIRKWRQLAQKPDAHEVLKLSFFHPDRLPRGTDGSTKQVVDAYKRYLDTKELQVP